MVEDEHPLRTRNSLEQLLHLLIIHPFDPLLIHELRLRTRMPHELKPVLVEGELVLAPARVVHDDGALVFAEIVLGLAGGRGEVDVAVRFLGRVTERCVVVERRGDVVLAWGWGWREYVYGHCLSRVVEAGVVWS